MLRSSIGIGGAALVIACLAWGLAPQDEARAEKDAKPAPIHVRLDAQGDVKATWKDAAGKASTLAAVSFGSGKVAAQAAAMEKLVKGLATPMQGGKNRGTAGNSSLRLVLEAEGDARWQWAQWVMQAAASYDVKIWQLELRRDKAKTGQRIELPRDMGLVPGKVEEFSKVKLTLFRKNAEIASEAFTRVRIDRDKQAVDLPKQGHATYMEAYDDAFAAIAKRVKTKLELVEAGEDVRAEVVAPPPTGGRVPYQDVLRLVEMLRAQKLQRIEFEGAAMPLMRRGPR